MSGWQSDMLRMMRQQGQLDNPAIPQLADVVSADPLVIDIGGLQPETILINPQLLIPEQILALWTDKITLDQPDPPPIDGFGNPIPTLEAQASEAWVTWLQDYLERCRLKEGDQVMVQMVGLIAVVLCKAVTT